MKPFLPEALADRLREKRLVFTVTTGRSGTGYLAKVLSFLPNAAVFHEVEPGFVDVMRPAQKDPGTASQFWTESKLPEIASFSEPIYVETTHLFCKGFFEPLLELGITPDLILLTRPRRQVATSLCQLNTIPARTEKGLRYLLSPDDPGVLRIAQWDGLTDYQLCFWYCLEIERRGRHYQEILRKKGSQVISLALNDIVTFRGILRMLNELRLPRPSPVKAVQLLASTWWRVNRKIPQKGQFKYSSQTLDRLENDVIGRVGL